MKRFGVVLLGFAGMACGEARGQSHAFAVERELGRMAAREHWPGYAPLGIPLAVFDGGRTWLFRHPAPPEGFRSIAGGHVFEGRHPAVTSNSSADIGGTPTATVLADGARAKLPARTLAAVAIHEAFHVFQRSRHAGWSGNEGDLLLYPVDDATLLLNRRLETEALRRALEARDAAYAACWARLALHHRQVRFSRMDSAFAKYERLTELNEGLATYVQYRAAEHAALAFPEGEFAASDVRGRTYVTGPALALLLDRLAPGWARSLEADDTQPLDVLLRRTIEAGSDAVGCAFRPDERSAIERVASRDAAAVVSGRASRRRAFDSRAGWKVVVRARADRPLWPQGFDPLNVERVDGGLLHTRFVRLGNDDGTVSAIDEAGADVEVLTVAAGAHPLFNGVREVTVAGLGRPTIDSTGGRLRLTAPGFTAEFPKARVALEGSAAVVEIAP